jgi:hypothetical protein
MQQPLDHKHVTAPDDLSIVLGFAKMLFDAGNASQPIVAGSTRVVSSPPPDTSLLARSCNKAEHERYFVFGESLPSRFSRSSTTLMREGKVPVASSKGRPRGVRANSTESMEAVFTLPCMGKVSEIASNTATPRWCAACDRRAHAP